jgi:hypothetical protein
MQYRYPYLTPLPAVNNDRNSQYCLRLVDGAGGGTAAGCCLLLHLPALP